MLSQHDPQVWKHLAKWRSPQIISLQFAQSSDPNNHSHTHTQ